MQLFLLNLPAAVPLPFALLLAPLVELALAVELEAGRGLEGVSSVIWVAFISSSFNSEASNLPSAFAIRFE